MKRLSFVWAVPVVLATLLATACGGGAGGSGGSEAAMEASSFSIGPSGGLVMLPDGTSVSIPKGALTESVTITVETNPSAPPVLGVTSTGQTYLFGPEGQQFQAPVTITLAIDPSLLRSGTSMNDVSIFTAPRGSAAYVSVQTSVANSLHVSAMTTHFSNFSTGVAHLGSINPDEPMTNEDMRGGQDITVEQMQAFLKSEHSALANYKDPMSEGGKSAAELIVTASQAKGLSPVYMLARLESEEGLVEGSDTWDQAKLDARLASATGCACPSACSTDYSGLHAQIECAAKYTAEYMADAADGTVSGWKINSHDKRTSDGCTVTPANAATVALYTYTPYEGYEYSSQYCARAYELTSENKDGLEVTGLAWIFYQYAKSFPGSTSSATDVTPCSGKGLGQAIARWAKAELGTGACSNNLGVLGFTTPGTDSNSCGGCGGPHKPEYWCADFASWVWNQAGVKDTSQLGSSTTLFQDYGTQHDTWKTSDPQVGDAILFPEHVAIVVKTYGDGYVDTMSGDWGGEGNADCGSVNCCAEEVEFSNTSSVQRNTHYAGWVCASDDTKCLGSQNATMYANVIGIAGPVGGSPTSCKATVTPAPSPSPTPTGPSSDDVCCATCVGQSSAYYAMQVPNLDGTLPSCAQAAQLFCTGTFGGGVSSSEISSCLVYGASDGGTTSSSVSCKLGSQTYPVNTCTETLQCNGSTWVPRTSDASGCNTGIEPGGACLTDSGSVAVLDTCTSTLQCNDGVWVDRDEDPALCNCSLAGRSYVTNTCTETVQCDDGEWVARDGDPSSCDTGFESNGSCLTDSGSVVPQNTCTSTLQCQNGVWVDRDDDPSSCL